MLPLLALLGSVTALGIGTSFAKQLLFPQVGAQGTTALRVGFSALLLLALWRPWRYSLTRADWQAISLYGVALGLMNLLFYMSIQTIPFGVAVAIKFAGPLAVAMVSSRPVADFVWMACAVLGLGLLLPWREGTGSLVLMGVFYALAAAVAWGLYIVFGKRTSHLHSGVSVSLGLAVAALVVLPVGVAHAGAALLNPTVLLIAVGVAAVSSAIPISLEMVALRRLPRETFGVMLSTEPAVAALLGLLLLGEHLSPVQWFAIGCIITASFLFAMTARQAAPLVDGKVAA